MTDLSQQRIQALGQQLTSIEDDLRRARAHAAELTKQLAPITAQRDMQRQLDDLAACLIDGTQPEVTPGVQARLVIHKQEKT